MLYSSDSDSYCSCSGCEAGRDCDSRGAAHQNHCHRTSYYQEQQRLQLNNFNYSAFDNTCPGCGAKGFYSTGHVCGPGFISPPDLGYINPTRGVPESRTPTNSYFPSRSQQYPQASSSTGYTYPTEQPDFRESGRQSRSTTRRDTPSMRSRSLSESSNRSSAGSDPGDLITDIGRLTP